MVSIAIIQENRRIKIKVVFCRYHNIYFSLFNENSMLYIFVGRNTVFLFSLDQGSVAMTHGPNLFQDQGL